MKKWKTVITAVAVAMIFSACGQSTGAVQALNEPQTTQAETALPENTVPERDEMQMETYAQTASVGSLAAAQVAASQPEGSNILIAYFTWGDNTVVEHPEQVDVDASTSASVLAPGNVARMASWIQEEVGGDLFSIQVEEPYSSDYDECLDRAADEKAAKARPALATHVENMDQYDTIFLGYPNWWYSVPMALHSFTEEYDLSGKKIVLFCSHGTGGLASSVRDLRPDLEGCEVEDNVIGVYRNDISGAQPRVQAWLEEIGY